MQRNLILLLLIISSISTSAQSGCGVFEKITFNKDLIASKNNPYRLIFEDEFNSQSLDTNKWLDRYPWSRNIVSNGELQYYSSKNLFHEKGILHIIAKNETVHKRTADDKPDSLLLGDNKPNLRTFDFTSGIIFSKQQFTFGKIEIHCKIPAISEGNWPAFWLFGANPCYEEMDVFEFMDGSSWKWDISIQGHPKCVSTKSYCNHEVRGRNYSKQFHTFTTEWDDFKITFYLDNKAKWTYYRYYITPTIPVKSPNDLVAGREYLENILFPTHAMSIIANQAIRNDKVKFPSVYEIDYIRVYSKQ